MIKKDVNQKAMIKKKKEKRKESDLKKKQKAKDKHKNLKVRNLVIKNEKSE